MFYQICTKKYKSASFNQSLVYFQYIYVPVMNMKQNSEDSQIYSSYNI